MVWFNLTRWLEQVPIWLAPGPPMSIKICNWYETLFILRIRKVDVNHQVNQWLKDIPYTYIYIYRNKEAEGSTEQFLLLFSIVQCYWLASPIVVWVWHVHQCLYSQFRGRVSLKHGQQCFHSPCWCCSNPVPAPHLTCMGFAHFWQGQTELCPSRAYFLATLLHYTEVKTANSCNSLVIDISEVLHWPMHTTSLVRTIRYHMYQSPYSACYRKSEKDFLISSHTGYKLFCCLVVQLHITNAFYCICQYHSLTVGWHCYCIAIVVVTIKLSWSLSGSRNWGGVTRVVS